MSSFAVIGAVRKSSATETDLIKQLRERMLTLLDGMEVERCGRGDALDELEQGLRNRGTPAAIH